MPFSDRSIRRWESDRELQSYNYSQCGLTKDVNIVGEPGCFQYHKGFVPKLTNARNARLGEAPWTVGVKAVYSTLWKTSFLNNVDPGSNNSFELRTGGQTFAPDLWSTLDGFWRPPTAFRKLASSNYQYMIYELLLVITLSSGYLVYGYMAEQ